SPTWGGAQRVILLSSRSISRLLELGHERANSSFVRLACSRRQEALGEGGGSVATPFLKERLDPQEGPFGAERASREVVLVCIDRAQCMLRVFTYERRAGDVEGLDFVFEGTGSRRRWWRPARWTRGTLRGLGRFFAHVRLGRRSQRGRRGRCDW